MSRKSAILILALSFGLTNPPLHAKTALEYLQAAPKTRFRAGHTLPPLTRWGWSMPFDVRVELTENWGYALEFGGYATKRHRTKILQRFPGLPTRTLKVITFMRSLTK